MQSPAMDSPLGCLLMPMAEKMTPKTHSIQLKNGIHENTSPQSAMTKPATPMPFFWTGGAYTPPCGAWYRPCAP